MAISCLEHMGICSLDPLKQNDSTRTPPVQSLLTDQTSEVLKWGQIPFERDLIKISALNFDSEILGNEHLRISEKSRMEELLFLLQTFTSPEVASLLSKVASNGSRLIIFKNRIDILGYELGFPIQPLLAGTIQFRTKDYTNERIKLLKKRSANRLLSSKARNSANKEIKRISSKRNKTKTALTHGNVTFIFKLRTKRFFSRAININTEEYCQFSM